MKRMLLTAASIAAFGVWNANAGTTTITLNGQKQGTETSTTIGSDGTITLKANCIGTTGQCASTTIETNFSPAGYQNVYFEVYNSNGTVEKVSGVRTQEQPLVITDNSIYAQFYPSK